MLDELGFGGSPGTVSSNLGVLLGMFVLLTVGSALCLSRHREIV